MFLLSMARLTRAGAPSLILRFDGPRALLFAGATLTKTLTLAALLLPIPAAAQNIIDVLGDPFDAACVGDPFSPCPWEQACTDLGHFPPNVGVVGMSNCTPSNGPGGVDADTEYFKTVKLPIAMPAYQDATCNDGSPGVFYWRKSANHPASRGKNRWFFYLVGGSHCASWENCAGRWCGEGVYSPARKMSSTPDVHGSYRRADGIFKRDPWSAPTPIDADGPIDAWNHVYVKYCSSDSHAGTTGDVPYADPDPYDPYGAYTLDNNGHEILAGIATWFLTMAPSVVYDGTGDPADDIAEATTIVLAGSSAGAKGVALNGDWFMRQLAGPSTETFLLFDSNVSVPDDELDSFDNPLTGLTEEIWMDVDNDGSIDAPFSDVRRLIDVAWKDDVGMFADAGREVGNPCNTMCAAGDADCFELGQLFDRRCFDTNGAIVLNLQDNAISKPFTQPDSLYACDPGGANCRATDRLDYASRMAWFFQTDLGPDPGDSVELIFAPNDALHVLLEDVLPVYVWRTPETFVAPELRVSDALAGWLDGGSLTWVDTLPAGVVKQPACDDGIDNDGDGDVDMADGECSDPAEDFEAPRTRCRDGIDNDGDRRVDWAGRLFAPPDADCAAAADARESH